MLAAATVNETDSPGARPSAIFKDQALFTMRWGFKRGLHSSNNAPYSRVRMNSSQQPGANNPPSVWWGSAVLMPSVVFKQHFASTLWLGCCFLQNLASVHLLSGTITGKHSVPSKSVLRTLSLRRVKMISDLVSDLPQDPLRFNKTPSRVEVFLSPNNIKPAAHRMSAWACPTFYALYSPSQTYFSMCETSHTIYVNGWCDFISVTYRLLHLESINGFTARC